MWFVFFIDDDDDDNDDDLCLFLIANAPKKEKANVHHVRYSNVAKRLHF